MGDGSITHFTRNVRCKDCGREFEQRGSQGCFGGHVSPFDCPDCGSERLKILYDPTIFPNLLLPSASEEEQKPPFDLAQFIRDLASADPADDGTFGRLVAAALHAKVTTITHLAKIAKESHFHIKFWKTGHSRLLPNADVRVMIYGELRRLANAKQEACA